MSNRKAPLQLTSSLTILALDWVVYAMTMISHVHALLAATLFGALATLVVVTRLENNAGSSLQAALGKALFASLAVAVPLPVIGSLVGIVGIVWHFASERDGSHA
jgi:hypothetical protein